MGCCSGRNRKKKVKRPPINRGIKKVPRSGKRKLRRCVDKKC
jgi:hypothetical protein